MPLTPSSGGNASDDSLEGSSTGSSNIDPISSKGSTGYNIPSSILKRLTPVSPQSKQANQSAPRNKHLTERIQRLKEYSERIDRVSQKQKSIVEKKRRYSNETLQKRLDSAHRRRSQSNSAKSARASESLKMMSSDDSIPEALKQTKQVLKDCKVGCVRNASQIHRSNNPIAVAVRNYSIRREAKELLNSKLFEVVISTLPKGSLSTIIASQKIRQSIQSIFSHLGLPIYHKNDPAWFLQSIVYLAESHQNDTIMNSLNTKLPKIQEKEPLNSVFNNKFNDNLVSLLISTARKLIVSFNYLLQSDFNKLGHPYLNFVKYWRQFNDVSSIFLAFHSIRSIFNLYFSIEILKKSQHLLQLKLKDGTYITIKEDLNSDIRKYDADISKLKKQLSVFTLKAEVPSMSDLYLIASLLKKARKPHNENDMFPTFVRSMQNWRVVLMHHAFNAANPWETERRRLKGSDIDDFYLKFYEFTCNLLEFENCVESLSKEENLPSFSVKMFDFLNNSMNSEKRLFPMIDLTPETFKIFFQTTVIHGFSDILDLDMMAEYRRILGTLPSDKGIEDAKFFLVTVVKHSIVSVLKANIPKDKIAFEKYHIERGFDMLSCPILMKSCLEFRDGARNIRSLIAKELIRFANDKKHVLPETLKSFRTVLRQIVEEHQEVIKANMVEKFLITDTLDQSLIARKEEIHLLQLDFLALLSLQEKCYKNVYDDVFGYIISNKLNGAIGRE